MAVTNYGEVTTGEGEGVLVNAKTACLNTTINRSSSTSKPTFVKPSFVPDHRLVLGENTGIVYTVVPAKTRLTHRELRRNTNTQSPRDIALAHINRPLRAPNDTTPSIPSSLSKVMAASYQVATTAAVVSTPPMTLKPFPADPLPVTKNSLGRRALSDATDSISTLPKHTIVKNYSRNNSTGTSVAAPSSSSSSDSDTMIEYETGLSSVEDMNRTSGSIRDKNHLDSNAEMSSPIIRQTRASLLREKHSKSTTKEGQDYTLAVPQIGRRTSSADHISSQKNGSPVARRGRSTRSISLDADQDKNTGKGDKTLKSRFSPEPAVPSPVSSDDQEFTLVDNEDTEVAMNGSGTVSSMRQRVTRLGVGPTMRFARDAGKVIFGCPSASTTSDEGKVVDTANGNDPTDNPKLIEHSGAVSSMAKEPVVANTQPARQLSRKHRARKVSQDFEKLFRPQEAHPTLRVFPHPPRKSSLPTSLEEKPPTANAPSNQSSVFSRLARPTASSSARTKSSMMKIEKNNAGKGRRESEGDTATSKDAVKKPPRVSGASLAKSDTMISVKNAGKGFRERFTAMVRSGRQSRADHYAPLSISTQGSGSDIPVAHEETAVLRTIHSNVSPTTVFNSSVRVDTNDEVLSLYYDLPESYAGSSRVIDTIAEINIDDSDDTYSTSVVPAFKDVDWDQNTREVANNQHSSTSTADTSILGEHDVESQSQDNHQLGTVPTSSADVEAVEATHPHDTAFINVKEDAAEEAVSPIEIEDTFVICEDTSQASTTPKATRTRSYSFPRPPSAAKQFNDQPETTTQVTANPPHNPSPSPAPEPTPTNNLTAFDTALSRATSSLLTLVELVRHTTDARTRRQLRLRIPDIHNTIAAAQNARIALQHAQQAYEGLVVTSITMSGEALTCRSAHSEQHQVARAEALETQKWLFRQLKMQERSRVADRDADGNGEERFNSYLQAQLEQQIEAHQSQAVGGHGHVNGHERESSRGSSGPVSP